MSGFAQTEQGGESAMSLRPAHRPSLSVILLSLGGRSDLERALAAVAGRCRRMEAEIVVVRAKDGEDCTTLKGSHPCVRFFDAPAGSDCAALRDIGMQHARGDIVALRQDGSVGDCMWLDAFRETVGMIDEDRPLEVEVALTVAVEESANHGDRRRARSGAYTAPSTKAPAQRRSDFGRTGAILADSPPVAPPLRSGM